MLEQLPPKGGPEPLSSNSIVPHSQGPPHACRRPGRGSGNRCRPVHEGFGPVCGRPGPGLGGGCGAPRCLLFCFSHSAPPPSARHRQGLPGKRRGGSRPPRPHPVPRTPSPPTSRGSQEPAGPTAPPSPHDLPPAAAAQGNRKGRAALGGSAGSGAGLSGAAAGALAARPAQAGQGQGERRAGADAGVPCPCQPRAPPSHWAMEASPRVRLRLSTRRRDSQRAENSAGRRGPGASVRRRDALPHSTQGLTPRFPPRTAPPARLPAALGVIGG